MRQTHLCLPRNFEGRTINDVKSRILIRCLPHSVTQGITGSSMSYEELVHAAFRSWSNLKEADRLAAISAVQAQPNRACRTPTTSFPRQVSAGYRQPGPAPTSQVSSPDNPTFPPNLCKFHRKWGDQARSCSNTCPRWPAKKQVFHIEAEEAPENP